MVCRACVGPAATRDKFSFDLAIIMREYSLFHAIVITQYIHVKYIFINPQELQPLW